MSWASSLQAFRENPSLGAFGLVLFLACGSLNFNPIHGYGIHSSQEIAMSFQRGLHFNSVLIKFQDTKNVPRVIETIITGM